MTMVPSESSKQKRSTSDYVFYSAMNQVGYNCLGSEFLVTRHNMAQPQQQIEDSSTPTNTTNTNSNNQQLEVQPEPEAEPEAGSTSKEEGGEGANNNNNWLQLSIGLNNLSHTTTRSNNNNHNQTGSSSGSGLVELELLPGGAQRHSNWASSSSSRPSLEAPAVIFPVRGSSFVFEQTTSSCSSSMAPSGPPTFGHQEMMNWAFGPLMPIPSFTTSSSIISQSCSSLRPPLASNYNYPPILPPFHHHHHFPSSSSSSGFDQFDVAGTSSDVTVRVVDPPRRPHSGIWFMLQASQNQGKEPFLPQIPKNYLRIKDGRMTVRLLLKYLVSKLKLESESEIEITCRGQQLLPFLTLQHVRDNIWTPRDITNTTRTLLSDSSTTDHVMVLHYGRSTS